LDKFIGSEYFDILLKFDVSYPYGDKEKEFVAFTHRVANMSGLVQFQRFLIGFIGVEDYGDKQNQDLADRFGVKASDFPVFKLWKRGSKEPIDYTKDVDADSLSRFISEELGLWIGLNGCIEQFDKLARGFCAATEDQRLERIKVAEQELTALDVSAEAADVQQGQKNNAKYYIRVMQKIIEKGIGFPQTEALRTESLLLAKITDQKKDELQFRLNILSSYGATLTKQAKKSEKENKDDEQDSEDDNNESP
jgi:endoplasmic reticulum protein 29